MLFVSNRDFVHASTLGHSIEFKKGVPTFVPPRLHREMESIGVIPAEGEEVVEEKPKSEIQIPELGTPDRERRVFDAFEAIVNKNDTKSFTAGGVPRADIVNATVGFPLEASERDELWQRFTSGGKIEKQ